MAYRHRNIPSREQSQVQTDVRLLESYLLEQQQREEQFQTSISNVRLSQVYSRSGILRPFSDQQLLQQFTKTLHELKQSTTTEATQAKRLQILESQINGLMKRDLLISGVAEGSQNWNDYYLTLNQKEKHVVRLQNEKAYSDLKIQRLRHRIQELEQEVDQLRNALLNSQKVQEENQAYQSFYSNLNNVLTKSKNRGVDLQKIVQEQVVPLLADFTMNITQMTRVINKQVPITHRPVVNNLAREFDRMLKEHEFNQERLDQTITDLVNNFKGFKGVDYLKEQFERAHRTEVAEKNYHQILSIFKSEFENLRHQIPNLKGVQRLDMLMNRLDIEGIQLIDYKGWINMVQPEIKVVQVNTEDKQLREFIGVLGAEFKRIYSKFPELKNHVSSKLVEMLDSEVLCELIQGASIEKLQELVVHQVDTIRVDNVYQYESSKDRQIILHLRVLIKSLLEQITKIKNVHGIQLTLDEGILGLLKEQILQGIDIEDILEKFRPPAKIIQVPVVIQTPVYNTKTFEKGVTISAQSPVVLPQNKIQVVTINREVPIYIEKPIQGFVSNNVPVNIERQKAVSVPVREDKIVDRIVSSTVQVPTIKEKAVPMYEREQVVREVEIEKVVEKVTTQEIEKLVETKGTQYVQIERVVEKPVYIYETRQQLKEVQVKVPQVIRQTEYIEVERKVPQVIQKREIVNIRQEVPVEIKVPEINVVEIVEYRDKPIITNECKEVIKEIQTTRDIQVVKEVPKEIFIERSHFIKGDTVQTVREVEVFVDKPIIKEILTTQNVQIQKVVPLYITEQIPVITEVPVPYFSEKVKELEVERVKLVPVREEIVKPIEIEKPVPVIVEKEIVRIEKQFVDRIVEKIVEVPRVVEVEKIVEKIVVVPRIVEKIVEVPKIIEKIVVIEQPVLQIVEIPVPHVIIQEVEKPVEVVVEKPIIQYEKEIETVEVEKIVERVIEKQKAVQVEVERRVPYEVVREVEVPTYRDRIQYQKLQIHETKVETIEVQVPFIVPEIVQTIVEKPIVTEHIIEQVKIEKIYIQKELPIINEVEKLVVREVIVEKAVVNEVEVQVPVEKIVYVDNIKEVEVIREKVVEMRDRVEVPKEIVVEVEKIVHEVHERLVELPVNKIVTAPLLMEVPKLVNLVHYKQVPVEVTVREERVQRDIIEQIKPVEVVKQVPFTVQVNCEKLKEIQQQIKTFITQEVVKEIQNQVAVSSPLQHELVEVPGKTVVQQLYQSSTNVEHQDRVIERVVEKIVMMPQIVEVVKNIHHISEVNSLGVALDVDVNVHTEKYLGVTVELRKALRELLSTFKSNVGRQPDLKNLISIIEKYLTYIEDWIKFPKLIEIPREVVKEVEKEKVVIVPTDNKEKEVTLSFVIQKLINQLRRIKESHKISLALDDQLTRIFFSERKTQEGLESRLLQMQESLRVKYSSFGNWADSNPFLVNAFLQDHFTLKSLIEEANHVQMTQSEELSTLRKQLDVATNKYNNLLCFNRKMMDDNNNLIKTLEKYRNFISEEEYTESIRIYRQFYEEISEEKQSFVISTIKRSYGDAQIEPGRSMVAQDSQVSDLIGKINKYQSKNQELVNRNRALESQLSKNSQQVRIKNSIIQRLETTFDEKVQRAKEELAKNPNLNKELFEENKKLQEKSRVLEREMNHERQNAEKAKREIERSLQNQKRESERIWQRRERQIRETAQKDKKDVERQVALLQKQIDRIKIEKEKTQIEIQETKKKWIEEVRTLRESQAEGASDKYNELLNQNMDLRKQTVNIETEFENFRRVALENETANKKQLTRLRSDNERLTIQKNEWQKGKKTGFMDVPDEVRLTNRNIELEKKIKQVENDLAKFKARDETSTAELKIMREKIIKLQIQLETSKQEVAEVRKLKATAAHSGFKSGVIETSSVVRSPKGSGMMRSGQGGYLSPGESSREQRIQEFGSGSSHLSHSAQSEQPPLPSYYKVEMSLREFIEAKHDNEKERDMYVTLVMIKIIEKIEQQVNNGIFNCYTPNNIIISNFSIRNPDRMQISLIRQISGEVTEEDGIYLAPELLGGSIGTRKSPVYCLGTILDQLIHGSTYFRSTEDVQNLQVEFKVRGVNLNPILKNTLFQMMNKEPTKRLELVEAKRRLSLQRYIASESRSGSVGSTRMVRPRPQE